MDTWNRLQELKRKKERLELKLKQVEEEMREVTRESMRSHLQEPKPQRIKEERA